MQLGGHLESLGKHIAAVDAHPLFHGIDFKLSSCTQPIHPQVAAECGFTMLSVRVVKVCAAKSAPIMIRAVDSYVCIPMFDYYVSECMV